MADSKMNPKPVFMDCHIEMHDKMLLDMQKSFKKLKKRIHRVELNLHLVPPDNEIAETEAWKSKVDKIIDKERVDMDFPTIFEVSDQYVKKHPAPVILSSGEQILFRKQDKAKQKAREGRKIPLKTLHKLAQIRETKNFGATKAMGAPETGAELKTLKNYKGCNTLTKGNRTIVRKDARAPVHMREGSSLPEWFGPGQYENLDPKFLRESRVSDLNASFKATERYQKSSEDWREQRLLHRSWSTNYSSQDPPDRFAEMTKSADMMFKSRESFQRTQSLEAERFAESQKAFHPDPYTSTLGTPVLGSMSTMGSPKGRYKVKDWTDGGLSLREDVFDPATFCLTEPPRDARDRSTSVDVEPRGAGAASFKGMLAGDEETLPARAKVLNKVPVPFVTKAQQQEVATTARLMDEAKQKREKPLKEGEVRKEEPWDKPVDCHKILRRNETNKYKHSRNMPVPTHTHLRESTEKKYLRETSAARALAGVSLKEDIGPTLKKWYAEQQIQEKDIGPHKPSKSLRHPVKVPLKTNNMNITRANLAATRAAAKEIEKRVEAASGPHAAPVIDFNKLKLKRIENDLDSLLLPWDGVNLDGAAVGISPPLSGRSVTSQATTSSVGVGAGPAVDNKSPAPSRPTSGSTDIN